MASFKTPPTFDSVSKPYSRWIEEIKAWQSLTELSKSKQGIAIALSLDDKDPSGIRDKVFNDVGADNLGKDNGVERLTQYMDNIFKKDELTEAYECYVEFDRFKRTENVSMEVYVTEFEKLYNRTKRFHMELPQSVLAFKLLEGTNLENKDRQLVLTGVNYALADELFKQMGNSLKKFFGSQNIGSVAGIGKSAIKIESGQDEVYANASFYDRKYSYRGRGRARARFSQNFRSRNTGYGVSKGINPSGIDGNPLRCASCDSIRHLIKDCPHSYENMRSEHRNRPEMAVLFTGNITTEREVLTTETFNSAVLDSACTSTVAGKSWLDVYLGSLNEQNRIGIEEHKQNSDSVFKFGNGECLKSLGRVNIPCKIAGQNCTIVTDIVNSDIPLLLSKDAMKSARVKLDLENDCAEIFGQQVDLLCTSAGHYCVPLEESDVDVSEVYHVLELSKSNDYAENLKVVTKLHKQFAHPSPARLKALVQDAGFDNTEIFKLIEQVSENCETCKRYKKTPSRPIVSLPLATDFNDCVAMDLKQWKNNIYFLHMIDVATRFSLASVIRDKKPETIIEQVMLKWIGGGFGAPKRFLADNGGEFANDLYRDMCQNLNIEVINTAALSPWQNGICERNHAVVDDCVSKILEDDPDISLDIALVWAINAKNSLQMVYGWSPHQLVFGINPNLPSVMSDSPPCLEGVTNSERFARHLNAIHSGRKAFIMAESAERIRKALRSKIRSNPGPFEQGEKVYYKRDDSHRWKGPGRVIGQDGKVVFVRHGSVYVRVHPCRLIRVGEEFCDIEGENKNSNCVDIDKKTSSGLQIQESARTEIDSDNEESVCENGKNVKCVKDLPDNGVTIQYRLNGQDMWTKSKVISRGGKTTGRNWAYLNIQNDGEDIPIGLDFCKDVRDWKYDTCDTINESDFDNENLVYQFDDCKTQVKIAKQKEIENWRHFNVFEEVSDLGQKTVSTRWVITNKVNDNNEKSIKARLVARGFEEDDIQADSPTATKETLKIFLALTVSNVWEPKSIDIKAAFLQGGEINREVYLKPPIESGDNNVLWKLRKCVYGLNDASRNWYMSVREKLLNVGCKQSSIDPALFFWHGVSGNLEGLFVTHVDDFLWAGKSSFKNVVISEILNSFTSGSQSSGSFKYIGLELNSIDQAIVLHQSSYLSSLEKIPINESRINNKYSDLNDDEVKLLREAIGQLMWLCNQSRPDLSFDVLCLSVSVKRATVEDLMQANKVIKRAKGESISIIFPNLGSLHNIDIILFTDASYANLSDGVSSCEGYIIFLKGENNRVSPVAWCSKKIRRVVKSTIAAETLSLCDGIDMAIYIRKILMEIIYNDSSSVQNQIICYVDNKSLYENIYSTKLVQEKRLRIDIASIKQLVENKEIVVEWVPTNLQLADCFTKKGASTKELIEILKQAALHFKK